ncbi:hypothetical protein XH99_20405 [Bradyrhizobium nanningense]|uniref:Uncharacterized protein n=2 Tax=Bradyrhizobium nanningense TaxID=1325118 RepID=A0A4Q0S1G1_9BRAD|nr:hypothetical protein XH99_20405 [Bradyrhizobium nanningense]RXH29539.1 hypothetical protein XH84_21215 [Bradyrhizobium nanningense]
MPRTSGVIGDENDFATIGAAESTYAELIDINLVSNISGRSPRMISCSHWGMIEIPSTRSFSKSVSIVSVVFKGTNEPDTSFEAWAAASSHVS